MLTRLAWLWRRWDNERRIRRSGWSGIFVGDYDHPPSWVYSIGFLESVGAPEIIAFDLPPRSASALLAQAYHELKTGKLRLVEGAVYLEAEDSRTVWRKVHPSRLDEAWLTLAQVRHAAQTGFLGEFEAFQLVLSNRDRLLPWDDGYPDSLRAAQPELYLPKTSEGA
jgi:hypothetical protein